MGRLVGLSLDQSSLGPAVRTNPCRAQAQVAANQGGAWVKSSAVGH